MKFEIAARSEDDKHQPPSMRTPGRILFRVTEHPRDNEAGSYFEFEVLDYDQESSVYWIEVNTGIDYWLEMSDIPGPGTYVIAGITGITYQDYFGEWDEDWDCEPTRPARWYERLTRRLW